jgi:hypothetical protein
MTNQSKNHHSLLTSPLTTKSVVRSQEILFISFRFEEGSGCLGEKLYASRNWQRKPRICKKGAATAGKRSLGRSGPATAERSRCGGGETPATRPLVLLVVAGLRIPPGHLKRQSHEVF